MMRASYRGSERNLKAVFSWLLMSLLSTPVWADSARAPFDYTKEVAGGKYVFVMLAARGGSLFDPGAPDDVGVIDPDRGVRKTYKLSGLYPADQAVPLWTVSWYAFTVFPASDGDHLVRLGPWASSTEQLAVAFYSKGVELKRYLIRDLVKDPTRLRNSVSHFFWMANDHFDDKTLRFYLKTVDGNEYTFSILTGEIIP